MGVQWLAESLAISSCLSRLWNVWLTVDDRDGFLQRAGRLNLQPYGAVVMEPHGVDEV